MKQSTCIVVFAKAPLAGFAKTRLIPALGQEGAAALANKLLQFATRQAAAAQPARLELCVTPDTSHPAFLALAQDLGLSLSLQGDGDLGARMNRAFERLLASHHSVIIVGTDAPALDASSLLAAQQALELHDAVFVPAHDGGYALVGLRRPCAFLFSGMTWSTSTVMQETRKRALSAGIQWHELPPVHDIDEPKDLIHLPTSGPFSESDEAAGRSCPLHYRYAPEQFKSLPSPGMDDLDVLYVVGGLYGNEAALVEIIRLFETETGRKRMVFNGDFHWFDAESDWFNRIQTGVMQFDATRGNVETELAAQEFGSDAGCGCAYPDWVDEATVQRSNRILQQLRTCVTNPQRAALSELPMWIRANVGGTPICILHGDAKSLSGWGFARENLLTQEQRLHIQPWFDAAQVDVFASSHTCTPVFAQVPGVAQPRWVLNNGAAGMPNLLGDACGLLTRIAVKPYKGNELRFSAFNGKVYLEAIAVSIDSSWRAQFVRRWPPASDAHLSYYDRITLGSHCELPSAIFLEH